MSKGTSALSSGISKWTEEHRSVIMELKLTLHMLRRSPLSIVGLTILIVYVSTAIGADLIAPYTAVYTDLSSKLLAPSPAHLFGTDEMGRDVFSRVVYGSRISLEIASVIVVLAASIGTILGAIAGYFGGKTNEIIMRITDIFLAFPSLVLAIAFAAALGSRSIITVMIAVSVTWWPWYVRLVQGRALSIREEQYVEAGRAAGASRMAIIMKHIIPNCTTPIIVQASLDLGYTLLAAAALGFLGIGAQPPTPEWGVMISLGRQYIFTQWWVSAFPGLAIFIIVLAFNLLGDGVRDALDPRLRRALEMRT